MMNNEAFLRGKCDGLRHRLHDIEEGPHGRFGPEEEKYDKLLDELHAADKSFFRLLKLQADKRLAEVFQ